MGARGDRVPGYADSLDDPGDVQLFQRHWIGVTPMEAELTGRDGEAEPGLARPDRAARTLDLRQTRCYGDEFGLWHTASRAATARSRRSPTTRRRSR